MRPGSAPSGGSTITRVQSLTEMIDPTGNSATLTMSPMFMACSLEVDLLFRAASIANLANHTVLPASCARTSGTAATTKEGEQWAVGIIERIEGSQERVWTSVVIAVRVLTKRAVVWRGVRGRHWLL